MGRLHQNIDPIGQGSCQHYTLYFGWGSGTDPPPQIPPLGSQGMSLHRTLDRYVQRVSPGVKRGLHTSSTPRATVSLNGWWRFNFMECARLRIATPPAPPPSSQLHPRASSCNPSVPFVGGSQ